MKGFRRLTGVLAAISLGAISGSAIGPAAAQGPSAGQLQPIIIKSTSPTLTTAVPSAMMAYRTDKARGLDVDFQAAGSSSTIPIDAVLAGQAQYGSAGAPTVMQAIRQGAPLKIVASYANNIHMMVIRNETMKKIGVSPTAPIEQRVRALKGLIIGTNPPGSTHYMILRAYLQMYGLDPDNDVRLVGVSEVTALISGLEQGRFDAITNSSGVVEFAIANGSGSLWISGPNGDIPGSKDVKTVTLFTRADRAKEKPAEVEAVRAALQDALEKIKKDPDQTGRLLREKFFDKLDQKVWDTAWTGVLSAYPADLAFSRKAYDYWVTNDAKGADSFKGTSYEEMVYGPAQSP